VLKHPTIHNEDEEPTTMPDSNALPHRIGDFTIRGLLGEGGIGIVYLAEQTEPVQRTVALEVLSEGSASAEILHRFAAERQALAVMDHPSIAKVFDAGSTDDGRPYFVMEVVEGSEIVEYCNARSLGLRERVTLYIDVCRAVQHAHQKGVIHQDIKPSNVLVSEVDGRPVPRVIDFGIAKAVETDDFEGTRLTRDDQVIGTPAYMSPEQVLHSADVDTRSNVFSLGVLLYELLVGALPYELASYRGWASVAANLHRDPPGLHERLAEVGERQSAVASQRSTTLPQLRKELGGGPPVDRFPGHGTGEARPLRDGQRPGSGPGAVPSE
jgi:serine/threonine protein kinase